MSRHAAPTAPVRRVLVGLALLLGTSTSAAALLGLAVAAPVPSAAPAATEDAPAASADPLPGMAPTLQQPATAAPATSAEPVRLRIPALGVDAGLEDLGLDASGRIEAPADGAGAGWYADGIVPGAVGPAVIAGHVDSATGPGVFLDLDGLQPGAAILVDLADGTTVEFDVDRSARHAKSDFPADAVYGATPDAELRLITCEGYFDEQTGHYVDNLVVFASRSVS